MKTKYVFLAAISLVTLTGLVFSYPILVAGANKDPIVVGEPMEQSNPVNQSPTPLITQEMALTPTPTIVDSNPAENSITPSQAPAVSCN